MPYNFNNLLENNLENNARNLKHNAEKKTTGKYRTMQRVSYEHKYLSLMLKYGL